MEIASVIGGNAEVGVMVLTPAPEIANWIVSSPAAPAAHSLTIAPDGMFVLAAMIASRSVHWPSSATTSAVLLTVMVAARREAAMRKKTATKRRFVSKRPPWSFFLDRPPQVIAIRRARIVPERKGIIPPQ